MMGACRREGQRFHEARGPMQNSEKIKVVPEGQEETDWL